MSEIDPKKLKVAELKEELKARGLDTKGNKAQLLRRLTKALAAERDVSISEADESVELTDTSMNESVNEPPTESTETPNQPAEVEKPEEQSTEPATAEQVDNSAVAEVEKESVEQPVVEAEPEQPEIKDEPAADPEKSEPAVVEAEPQVEETSAEPEEVPQENKEPEVEAEHQDEQQPATEPEPEVKMEAETTEQPSVDLTEPEQPEVKAEPEEMDQKVEEAAGQDEPAQPEVKAEQQEAEQETTSAEVKAETKDGEADEKPMETGNGDAENAGEGIDLSQEEFQVMDQVGGDDEVKKEGRATKRRHSEERSRSRSRDRHHRHRRSRSRSRDRKRQRSSRSRSPQRQGHSHRSRSPVPIKMDDEDWLQNTSLTLDRYNSDLNLRINENGFKANPITVEGFAYMWAGARANYGVAKGKVAFEVKITDELKVDHLPSEEKNRHVVRVGFSADATSMQLGEEPLSYGYGGTAKASTDCKFKDFGEKFGIGDVIGAYLDFDAEPIAISYTKNGEDQGVCFEVERATLGENALFPHVLSKNSDFEVNFGQMESPFFSLKEGFTFINDVVLEDRVRGSLPPEKKEDCQIIMMCGLPAAGKSYWAAKQRTDNPEKKYNVLGTNDIIDKMKVMGLPRKKNYAGRWDVLIDLSSRCLNKVLEIASRKKRNYILDQTNVYPKAQKRKMAHFEGFHRKAVVIVPSDEEFKNRFSKKEKEEGKWVTETAVNEMKANFSLPEEGSVFNEVEFVELNQEEASKLVAQYNKDAAALRSHLPPDKRSRFSNRDDRFGRDQRGRGRYDNDRRDHRGGGGYRDDHRGGYRGGRDHDRYRGGRGGYDRDRNRGGYMGYSNNDRNKMHSRGSDYRDRKDSNRYGGGHHGSGGGGNWNNQKGWGGHQGGGGHTGQWGNQGWNQNQGHGSWGQGQWGQQGSWGQQGWGQQQPAASSWNQYSQGQQQQQAQQASWGQQGYQQYQYNYQYPQQPAAQQAQTTQQTQQQPAATAAATPAAASTASTASRDAYNQWYYSQQGYK